MAHCNRCNRRIEGSKRDHICDTVTIQNKETEATQIVHASRVEKGGDLYKAVRRNGKFEVVFRAKGKIEKLFEKEQKEAA